MSAPAGVYHASRGIATDLYRNPQALRYGPLAPVYIAARDPGSMTRRLAVETARGTYQDLRHPLRHPGYTALTGLALLSGGAGAAARAGAAGRVVRSGGGAGKAAKALARRPAPGARTFRYQGQEARGLYSANAALRRAQKLLDKARERWPEAPLGRRVSARVGFERGEARRIEEALARAPAHELRAAGRRLTSAQQTAIRAVAEGVPIRERINFHANQLRTAKGRSRRGHRRQVALLRAAGRYVDDVGGKPRFRPGNQSLERIYGEARRVARERGRILTEVGALSPRGARERVSAPGRVIRGEPVRREVTNQLRLSFGPKVAETITRPRTPSEARARLRELENRHETFLERVHGTLFADRLSPDELAEQSRRNAVNARIERSQKGVTRAGKASGAVGRYRGAQKQPTVREEHRRQTEDFVEEQLERLGDDPAAVRFRRERDELRDLREALNPLPGDPVDVGRLGTATMQRWHELVPELFEGGEFRVPYTTRRAPRAHGRPAVIGGSRRTVGIPEAPASVRRQFTGGLLKAGTFRDPSTRLIAESYIEAQRYGALLRARDEITSLAKAEPTDLRHDIPVRLDALRGRAMNPIVREIQERAEEGVKLSRAERQALGTEFEALRREIFDVRVRPDEVGRLEGVGWIDRRTLGGLDQPNPLIGLRLHPAGQRALSIVDAVNNAQRMAILYLKPAYAIPNLLGNLTLNLIQQGFAAPRNLAHAVLLERKLGPRTAARIDAVMGDGMQRALAGETGIGQRATQFMANFWGRGVDVPFRRASFLHEARRAGFSKPEELRRLLRDEELRPTLIDVSRRANRAIIDYARLGPFEREIVRRVVFFYPWVKGATMYAGRFVGEHPIQAAVMTHAGEQGRQFQEETLGELPSFAEAIFPVGEREGMPLVVDPSAAAIFQTPAGIIETGRSALAGDFRPGHQLSGYLTPGVAGLGAAVFGVDPFTRRSVSPAEALKGQLWTGLPQVTLHRRLTEDQSDRLYPYSQRDAVLQFLFGGLAPRPVDPRRLREYAEREAG